MSNIEFDSIPDIFVIITKREIEFLKTNFGQGCRQTTFFNILNQNSIPWIKPFLLF